MDGKRGKQKTNMTNTYTGRQTQTDENGSKEIQAKQIQTTKDKTVIEKQTELRKRRRSKAQ